MAGGFSIKELKIKGARLITSEQSGDDRGSSSKINAGSIPEMLGEVFEPLEILTITSKKNVLRGLHYQKEHGQSRVLQCLSGNLLVALADIDEKSPTFGRVCTVNLTDPSQILYAPAGCALGSLAIEESVFHCLCGENVFMSEFATGIRWDDQALHIDWGMNPDEVIISERDKVLPSFEEATKAI